MGSLGLLVLRCDELERTRAFYEAAELHFVPEQHGEGPPHFSATLGTLVIELYPATPTQRPEAGLRLGLSVTDVAAVELRLRALGYERRGNTSYADPDGRIVVLS